MTNETTYSIGELAEAAGVTTRTIRYYTAEGLLPAPETQGKYARYTADHLQRLRLIAQLKETYLPLHEIRQRIAQLRPEQVTTMLNEAQAAPHELAESSSAEDYIANVVARQRTVPAPAAEVYGAAHMRAPGAPQPPMAAAPAPAAAAPAPQPAPGPQPARGGFLRRLLPQQRPVAPPDMPQAEAWRRVALAPGVELHVREPADPATQERVQTLIEQARTLFAEHEP